MSRGIITISSIEPSWLNHGRRYSGPRTSPTHPLIWVHRSCFPQDSDRSLFFRASLLANGRNVWPNWPIFPSDLPRPNISSDYMRKKINSARRLPVLPLENIVITTAQRGIISGPVYQSVYARDIQLASQEKLFHKIRHDHLKSLTLPLRLTLIFDSLSIIDLPNSSKCLAFKKLINNLVYKFSVYNISFAYMPG